MKSRLMLVAALSLVLASVSSGTSEKPSSNKTISICPIEYTPFGKKAYGWRSNFTYSVLTDAGGMVLKVTELPNIKTTNPTINEAALIECVKTWKLLPQGQYSVWFNIGMDGDGNFLSIRDPPHNILKVVLP